MPRRDPTRRRLLRLAALGGAAGLAGCQGVESLPRALDPTGPDGTGATPGGPAEATTAAALPYDEGPAVDPRGVAVRNVGRADRYVTVVVETGAGDPVFVGSESVAAGRRVAYPDLVAAAGTYRVVVETADGRRAATDWVVGRDRGDLVATVTDRVTLQQTVTCAPTCSLARGGTAVGYPPDGDFAPRGRRAGTTLRVVNPAGRAATRVRVRVGDGDPPILDYRYDLPAGVTVELPVPQHAGVQPVLVAAGDRTARYDWQLEATPSLRAVLGDRVRFGCGGRSRDLRLVNEGTDPAQLSVRVVPAASADADGGAANAASPTFAGSYDVSPGEPVAVPDVVASAGDYLLRASTAAGATATYAWTICPPRGPVMVRVAADGSLLFGRRKTA